MHANIVGESMSDTCDCSNHSHIVSVCVFVCVSAYLLVSHCRVSMCVCLCECDVSLGVSLGVRLRMCVYEY